MKRTECSHCGKTLTWRQQLKYEDRTICKSCLESLENKQQSGGDETERVKAGNLQQVKAVKRAFTLIVLITAFVLSKVAPINFYGALILSAIFWFIFRPLITLLVQFFSNEKAEAGPEAKSKKSDDIVCLKCKHFDSTGVCTHFHFDVRAYPKKMIKKCNGMFFVSRE